MQARGLGDAAERFNHEDEARKTLTQIVLGAFGLVVLYFTWRRVRVAEQGHITERYTKAIEQLGALAVDKPNIEIRLGAIYALERIAFDSPRDHWTIMEVLTAYVRSNAPAPPEPAGEGKLRTDIQAILTVLGRRRRDAKREKSIHHFDLSNTDLRGANMWMAQMAGASLDRANMAGADLREARLEGASSWEPA